MELEELIETLARPGALPDGETVEEVRQTHASVVFLTRDHAWKLKKPVDFGFLDYSTARKRARMCRHEVALNRRLAPDVYLGVAKVRLRADGSVGVASRGPIVDSLVKMRRLDDNDSLAARVADARASEAEVRAVAQRLAAFHRECPPAPAQFQAVSTFLANQADNLDGIMRAGDAPGDGGFVERLRIATAGLEETVRNELPPRQASGLARDGHGDLRMDHVYIEDGRIEVIDCIEFNDQFRYADVALDIAFLAMDLESKGYPDLAKALLEEHGRALGDEASDSLIEAYLCYRAMVRAKVAVLASEEAELGHEAREVQKLKALHATLHAWRFATGERRPRLVLTMGLTGTGKSTVAGLLAGLLGAKVISADETRKRLSGRGEHEHPASGLDSGLYSAEMNTRVYSALLDAAAESLAPGRSVILDATYQRAADRRAARDLAESQGALFTEVLCETPEPVIKERLRQRAQGSGDRWSDAGWEVYLAQRSRPEWPDDGEERWTERVSTSSTKVEIARRLFDVLTTEAAV
ncbi:MAG: AAA family ATPase [Dehalococcoidia bacterium]